MTMKSMTMIASGLLLAASSWSARAANATPADSLCAVGEKIVFSCPLAGGKKVVSICAAGEGRFHYAFGSSGAPEFTYPSKGTDATFARTHLTYGGANGGAAYSFANGGYKYIVYSVSGTGVDEGGVLVQRVGEQRAAKDMKCQSGKVTGPDDDGIIDAILKWKSDPDIQSHGLPSTH